MPNRIDKNVKKGSIGGLITLLSTTIAVYIVSKYHLQNENIPVITCALTALFLGIYDALKHKK